MKHLIFFLLFSTVVFSQNYNYSLEEAQKKSAPAIPTVNNQLEEIEYFKAILWPITKKATLQVALDTYGAVRLEEGDYRGVNIVMKSNQRLYGHPSLTRVSPITIAAGSTNVHIENLTPGTLTLQSGGVISGCTFKTIRGSTITGTNIMFQNNLLVNIVQSRITIDCSGSGYIRNNKIIRHQVQSNLINLVMKGNSATPSYGNVHLWTNFLTPHGDVTNIDNLKSATFVGLDAEGWNLNGLGTNAMFYAKNMGDVKITDLGGSNSYSAIKTSTLDIDANNLLLLNKYIGGYGSSPTISPKTNLLYFQGRDDDYVRSSGTVTGFDLKAHFRDDLPNNGIADNDLTYNGIVQNSLITDSILLSNTIKNTQYTPWNRPTWETLPDPLGANWRTERVGKPDSRAYIQNLIDTNGIAELPEGIFYIGSSLILPLDDLHGIQGQGTGKTVICGLTDDFPLIRTTAIGNGSWHINNLTFQGGNTGIFVEKTNVSNAGQIRFLNMNYVTFKDTNYGIHLYRIMGMDNCFFNHVAFVNCNRGFYQEPLKPYVDYTTSSYIDKVVFYKSQFINCETAFSMIATRADNLNAWIECKFDGGAIALNLTQQGSPIIANCDFTNYDGMNLIKSNRISIYSSNFSGNTMSLSMINSPLSTIEGCNFLDAAPMFSPVMSNTINNHILNSTITGNVVVTIPPSKGYGLASAIYSNSILLSNPTLSKLLVNVKDNVPTVILDATPTPYPQLLVTQ
ncbi:hypothetical protein [Flavobacterium sp.]|jgi:hypothetical protein|uniref:hypothetical protein n=1 Tax=Flavobacterium sp. TaxID=239 RepID=UPI0037C0A12B